MSRWKRCSNTYRKQFRKDWDKLYQFLDHLVNIKWWINRKAKECRNSQNLWTLLKRQYGLYKSPTCHLTSLIHRFKQWNLKKSLINLSSIYKMNVENKMMNSLLLVCLFINEVRETIKRNNFVFYFTKRWMHFLGVTLRLIIQL